MVIQGILANPTHCFHDGSEFLHSVSLHVILTVACHSLCVDPHDCHEFGPCPTFFPSHPSMLSITATENSDFVWMALSKSNQSSTKDCQNCFNAYSLVNLALALSWALGHVRPVLPSRRAHFPSHASALQRAILYACPPTTGQLPKHIDLFLSRRGCHASKGSSSRLQTRGIRTPT